MDESEEFVSCQRITYVKILKDASSLSYGRVAFLQKQVLNILLFLKFFIL